MLTIESILSKTYTPRDLWQTLELYTQLRAAVERHQAETQTPSEADKILWEILDRGIYKL